MPLTDVAIRSAKPRDKALTSCSIAAGFICESAPTGGKWWRWKYRFGGKEKRLSFGVYPDVTLKSAREKRDAARSAACRRH